MKDMEIKISQFVDGELDESELKEFFTELALDTEAERMLSEFIKLKVNISSHYTGMQPELKSSQVKQSAGFQKTITTNRYKIPFYISAAASIILLIMLSVSQLTQTNIKNNYDVLQSRYNNIEKHYSEALKIIDSTKTETHILRDDLARQNFSKSTVKTNPGNRIVMRETPGNKEPQNRFANAPRIEPIKITHEDFIGARIVGN